MYEEEREKAAFALSKVKVTAREQEAVQEGYRLWLELGRRKEEKEKKERNWNSSVANKKTENKEEQKLQEEKEQASRPAFEGPEKEKRG